MDLAETVSLLQQAIWALVSNWAPEQVCRGIYGLSLLKIEPHNREVSQVWPPHSLSNWLIGVSMPVPGLHGHIPTAQHRPQGIHRHPQRHTLKDAHVAA